MFARAMMIGTSSLSVSSPLAADPNYANARILLPLNEASGGGLNLTDYSPLALSVSTTGATWQTGVSKFYGGAAQLSTYTITSAVDAGLAPGTSSWSFRCWYRTSTKVNNTQVFRIGNDTYSLRIGYHDGSIIVFYISNNGSSWTANGLMGTFANDTWHHLEVCYNGTNVYAFVDGVLGSTTAFSGTLYINTNSFSLAAGASNAYIQDVAFYIGTVLHTSSFTPPGSMLA